MYSKLIIFVLAGLLASPVFAQSNPLLLPVPQLNQMHEPGAESFALVDADGNVVNVISMVPGADYEPPEGLRIVPVGENAEPGGSYDGATKRFARKPAPDTSPASLKLDLQAEIDALKAEVEALKAE